MSGNNQIESEKKDKFKLALIISFVLTLIITIYALYPVYKVWWSAFESALDKEDGGEGLSKLFFFISLPIALLKLVGCLIGLVVGIIIDLVIYIGKGCAGAPQRAGEISFSHSAEIGGAICVVGPFACLIWVILYHLVLTIGLRVLKPVFILSMAGVRRIIYPNRKYEYLFENNVSGNGEDKSEENEEPKKYVDAKYDVLEEKPAKYVKSDKKAEGRHGDAEYVHTKPTNKITLNEGEITVNDNRMPDYEDLARIQPQNRGERVVLERAIKNAEKALEKQTSFLKKLTEQYRAAAEATQAAADYEQIEDEIKVKDVERKIRLKQAEQQSRLLEMEFEKQKIEMEVRIMELQYQIAKYQRDLAELGKPQGESASWKRDMEELDEKMSWWEAKKTEIKKKYADDPKSAEEVIDEWGRMLVEKNFWSTGDERNIHR
ncbi:hypothetical protein FJY90_00645 [Candidatus Gottesmanbacteria bacterium]|nr:hypothetical protein [Candidatus Gottesmanbacteria bacterium]